MTWNLDDPQGNEAAKCRWDVVPYIRGKGIDIGCGPNKVLPHAIGIDSCKDVELFGLDFKPDLVCEDAADLAIPDGDLDFVFSSHLLEHIPYWEGALREWWRVLKVGAIWCCTCRTATCTLTWASQAQTRTTNATSCPMTSWPP